MSFLYDIDDRVSHTKDGTERHGNIKSVCTDRMNPIALVKFDDGSIEKVFISELYPLSDKDSSIEIETVEKTEIIITPEQFRTIAINELKKLTLDGSIMDLSFTGFIIELHKALFFDSVSENS